MQRNRIMKPITRVAQANPTFGIKDCRSNGNTIPPKAHPVAAIPVALPRRRLKKWPIAAMEGVKSREVPTPPLIPKTTIKCQYSKQVSSERLFTRIGDNDLCKPRARTWKLQRKRFQGEQANEVHRHRISVQCRCRKQTQGRHIPRKSNQFDLDHRMRVGLEMYRPERWPTCWRCRGRRREHTRSLGQRAMPEGRPRGKCTL
jgi:hypothetical protein